MSRKSNKMAYHCIKRDEQPEDALWRHVITQAIQDAARKLSANGSGAERAAIVQARQWFSLQCKDFHDVCSMAGLEAANVHAFAMAQIRKTIDDAHEATVTENFLKGSMPGVVAEIRDGLGDRSAPTAQENYEIDFSQNRNLAKCR
jgi:hypothetical protein